jgi:chemotaxis protein MotB
MAKKGPIIQEGAPEWIVTFADLMSLLVCFFVLIISFSIQDKEKMQIVAGSMRDAFGVRQEMIKAGMIEFEGVPVREFVKHIAQLVRENDTDFADERHDQNTFQGPEANTHDYEQADIDEPRHFALAATSLRQAWQELPDITELSANIIVDETPEGLHIQLIDQDGRAMFRPGSAEPYAHMQALLSKMAPVLAQMPNRVRITGHSDASRLYREDGYSLWELTADRANMARRILAAAGLQSDQIASVVGKADTEPLFPDDTFLAANRRISILIIYEEPPLDPDHNLTHTEN